MCNLHNEIIYDAHFTLHVDCFTVCVNLLELLDLIYLQYNSCLLKAVDITNYVSLHIGTEE